MPDGDWPIVGSFKSGDVLEGQVLGDVETMVMALDHIARTTTAFWSAWRHWMRCSTLSARTRSRANPALVVSAERHSDWYTEALQPVDRLHGFLTGVAYAVGGLMAIGALFGCLNTMYAAVSTRGREIATLRALGFGALPVAVSVILEAVFLSVAGALIGAAVAWTLFDGKEQVFGNNVYHLTVSSSGIGLGVIWACGVALLGGLFPSIRAARRPVVEALRAT